MLVISELIKKKQFCSAQALIMLHLLSVYVGKDKPWKFEDIKNF
jgi:hypothetical protein